MDDLVRDRIRAHRSAPDVYDPPTFEEMAQRIEALDDLLRCVKAVIRLWDRGDEPVLEAWDYEDEFFFRHAIDNLRASLEAMK